MSDSEAQVDAPSGHAYVVRVYRSGTMSRFPSAAKTPLPGGALYWPAALVGLLIHLVAFRRSWTVAVVPWHNLPGPRYRERASGRVAALHRAQILAEAIRAGTWGPEAARSQA
jgi:hypothetical protein